MNLGNEDISRETKSNPFSIGRKGDINRSVELGQGSINLMMSDEDELALREKLNGSVKSKFAQKFQLETNIAIEKSLGYKKKTYERRHTKGSFADTQFRTTAGCWMKDRDWQRKANQVYQS